MNLQFYLDPPELSLQAQMEITALAPLSMVPTQPGTYYRSFQAPTMHMLHAMLENALGWHFSPELRKEVIKQLSKAAKKAQGRHTPWKDHPWLKGKHTASESGYISLLQYHLETRLIAQPPVSSFEDLWSQHLRSDGISFIGGSRTYDYRLEPLIAASRTQEKDTTSQSAKKGKRPKLIEFGDRKGFSSYDSLEELLAVERGKINTRSIHPYFPRYYVSPKLREYVIPQGNYRYEVYTTPALARQLEAAIENPAGPLYLGTNDGWIHLNWMHHETV
ncbi:MAG: hypothetical protein D6730_20755 [Bacteroidetes bacterium]|nr:MAG: hypothetical protein D6730_20755 [Bacteroidota bacterium]